MEDLFQILIIFLAFGGFLISFYIEATKKKAQPMVCPMGGKCDVVTTSRFSKFLGVPLTWMGMGYYGLIALLYAAVIVVEVVPPVGVFLITGISIGAFFFSLYLTAIQGLVLKDWCTWCLGSAAISTIIAILSVVGTSLDLSQFLADYKGIIVILHALSAAVGVGATTVTDVMFFRFMKDYKISETELRTMKAISQVIWGALGLLIITGIGLYIPQSAELLASSKFLLKVFVVTILTLNGVVLNLIVTPRLPGMNFDGEETDKDKPVGAWLRRLAFAAGGVSIISWYLTFILGSLRSIPINFERAVLYYILVLLFVLVISQVMERSVRVKAKAYNHTGQ